MSLQTAFVQKAPLVSAAALAVARTCDVLSEKDKLQLRPFPLALIAFKLKVMKEAEFFPETLHSLPEVSAPTRGVGKRVCIG